MFSHDSTENLLDTLESELTEMIELDTPKSKKDEKSITAKKEESKSAQNKPPDLEVATALPQKKEPPPVPARRSIQKTPLTPEVPVPTTRSPIGNKNEKNNENEIIQLQSIHSEHESMSSESMRNSQASSKHNTVISINEKKGSEKKSIRVVHEAEHFPGYSNESFFVIKHGKWAEGEEAIETKIEKEIQESQTEVVESQKNRKMSSETSSSKKQDKKKKISKRKSKESTTTSVTTSFSTSSSDSSTEETPQPQKKTKKWKQKDKKSKKKSRKASEEQNDNAEDADTKDNENLELTSSNKAIGIYIYGTGSMHFRKEIKGLRVKVSLFNEDNGKQIGDVIWTKLATYNNDFYNFKCFWNEHLRANFDLKRLREIYNNVIIFFEVINKDSVPVFWAFLKLFSPNFTNIDTKLKLQLYEYHTTENACFSMWFKKNTSVQDFSIYEQYQMRKMKLPCFLNIFVKDVNLNKANDEVEMEEEAHSSNVRKLAISESFQRHWRKIPGQACKVPNKIFHKIPLHDKGSLIVKFSHDGNFLAFTEVMKMGHILHIYNFPEMKELFVMLVHSDIIHDVDWKKQKQYTNGHYLATASGDFTAIVWLLVQGTYTYSILPHPSFVFGSKFLQNDDDENVSVITTCRDNYIRIWRKRKNHDSFEILQEIVHPKVSTFTYITQIATRSSDVFFTSSSTGDIIEFIVNGNGEFKQNRHFRITEIRGRIICSMELNPRGNKLCLRLQDTNKNEVSDAIYVLGITTGTLTQIFNQFSLLPEAQGRLKISPCGTQIYSTSGSNIYHYQMVNGNIVASEDRCKNALNIHSSLGDKGFISSMDYHSKDFFLACAVYGGSPSCLVVFSFESDEKDPIEIMKMGSNEPVLQKSLESKQIGSFSEIIQRLDSVFLAPTVKETVNVQQVQECHSATELNNTFTIESNSKRSKTYTVSQGPATFTIQKGGTYEIQKNDGSDDDETTISESLN